MGSDFIGWPMAKVIVKGGFEPGETIIEGGLMREGSGEGDEV